MFSTLADAGVEVLDIEQIVLRQRLVLGILVTAPRDVRRLDGRRRGDRRRTRHGRRGRGRRGRQPPRREGRAHVTLLGRPLRPDAVAAVTGRIADTGANIDRIVRMARYPVTAIEFNVSGAEIGRLREVLATEAARQSVDVAVQSVGLLRHGRRLVVMDVDSTLVQGEVVDMLAERAGVAAEVTAVTERAMHGDLDFEESLRRAGRPAQGTAGVRPRRGVRRDGPVSRGAHAGPHPQAARLPLRDRLGWFQPAHRPARRGPGHRLRPGQRARGRRRPAHRRGRRRRRRPPARRRRCSTSRRPGSRSTAPSRSATARTTSTCSPPQVSASRSTPSRSSRRRRTRRQRPVPRRDPLPARDQPRGHRGRRRRARHRRPRSAIWLRNPSPSDASARRGCTTPGAGRARLELGPAVDVELEDADA